MIVDPLKELPTFADIEDAATRLKGVTFHTPLLRSDALDAAVMDATLDHDVILDALYEAGGALVGLGPDAGLMQEALVQRAQSALNSTH